MKNVGLRVVLSKLAFFLEAVDDGGIGIFRTFHVHLHVTEVSLAKRISQSLRHFVAGTDNFGNQFIESSNLAVLQGFLCFLNLLVVLLTRSTFFCRYPFLFLLTFCSRFTTPFGGKQSLFFCRLDNVSSLALDVIKYAANVLGINKVSELFFVVRNNILAGALSHIFLSAFQSSGFRLASLCFRRGTAKILRQEEVLIRIE